MALPRRGRHTNSLSALEILSKCALHWHEAEALLGVEASRGAGASSAAMRRLPLVHKTEVMLVATRRFVVRCSMCHTRAFLLCGRAQYPQPTGNPLPVTRLHGRDQTAAEVARGQIYADPQAAACLGAAHYPQSDEPCRSTRLPRRSDTSCPTSRSIRPPQRCTPGLCQPPF